MTKDSENKGRRNFIIVALAGILGIFTLSSYTKFKSLSIVPIQGVTQEALDAFNNVLSRTKIRIYTPLGTMVRDLRDKPYSNDIEYGWEGSNPWYSSFIRTDEADKPEDINLKASVLWGLYYSPHNSDNTANKWGDVPVVVCDTYYTGLYNKDILADGIIIHSYRNGVRGTNSRWIHYNMKTNEVKAF